MVTKGVPRGNEILQHAVLRQLRWGEAFTCHGLLANPWFINSVFPYCSWRVSTARCSATETQ